MTYESETFSITSCRDSGVSQSHMSLGHRADTEDDLGSGHSWLSRSGRGWSTEMRNGEERPKPWQRELLLRKGTRWRHCTLDSGLPEALPSPTKVTRGWRRLWRRVRARWQKEQGCLHAHLVKQAMGSPLEAGDLLIDRCQNGLINPTAMMVESLCHD